MAGKLFIGGVPTRPEVDTLMRSFTPVAGASIPIEELARIVNVDPGGTRMKTILTAWRKRLFREKRIQTLGEDRCIRFLTADESLNEKGVSSMRRAGKSIAKSLISVAVIDDTELSNDNMRQLKMLYTREATAMLDHLRASAKRIEPPRPLKIGK